MDKILPFLKKYPMSILLALIAINLFSIAGSLRTSAKLDKMIITCVKWQQDIISVDKAAKMIGISRKDMDDYFCRSLDNY